MPTPGPDPGPPLTPEQRAAVTTRAPRVSILAGPGSGKTHTLTARVSHLVAAGEAPEGILLLTFTLRAARAMAARLSAHLGHRAARIRSGTFHALAHAALRAHGPTLGLRPGWTVAGRDEQERLMRIALTEALGIAPEDLPARRWLELGGLAINTQRSLTMVFAGAAPAWAARPDRVEAVYDSYAQAKAAADVLDFDDLLLLFKALLLDAHPAAAAFRDGVRHVLVDEYQDTTPLQAELSVRLAEAGSLTVVGDDAQSIYGFRGARVENLRGFSRSAPTERHALSLSHRCSPEILAVANALAARDPDALEKTMRSAVGAGPRPAWVELDDPAAQARFVAERIARHHAAGLPLAEMAVLFRTHAQAAELELALTREGLAWRRRGPRRADDRVVPAAIAHVALQEGASEAAWRQILSGLEGVGPRTLERLLTLVDPHRAPGATARAFCEEAPRRAHPALLDLAERLEALAGLPPAAQIDALADPEAEVSEGFFADLRLDADDEAPARARLRALAGHAAALQDAAALASIWALDPDPAADRDAKRDAVALATVHQAKGLEWSTVFVVGLAEGLLPLAPALEEPGGLAEERRVLYVAVTRAKDALYLCSPGQASPGAGAVARRPSRYLFEIPTELLEVWSIR